ncbi:MAG: efflux RND transporter periplasmic adaptor subunit [Gammaproteobacteria bacterium]|nr:efflux RND transporter periplasmic adaptor subunit [Gammaproteobacteria bacterium]
MRLKRWAIVVGLCIGMVAVLGFIKFTQIRAAIAFGESFPEPSETVETLEARFSDWQARISVVGEVRASRELVLRTEVEGIIAKIGFTSGARVQAGDLLIQLDISEEQARLKAIKPEIELARENARRISGLSNNSAISRQQADQIKAQLSIAKAQEVSVMETIANKAVVAPFSGFVGLHDFEVGEFLAANTVITTLVGDLQTLWVDFSLPQKYAQLTVGTIVSVRAPDISDAVLQATVLAVEPNISADSRNLKVRAVLGNPDLTMKPGSFVQVSAPIGNSRQVIRLPSAAVRVDTFGAYVFRLAKDDAGKWRASRRPVTVITKEGDESIVSEGIEVGDVIATVGSFKLREGILVNQSNRQESTDTAAKPSVQQEGMVSDRPRTIETNGNQDKEIADGI